MASGKGSPMMFSLQRNEKVWVGIGRNGTNRMVDKVPNEGWMPCVVVMHGRLCEVGAVMFRHSL